MDASGLPRSLVKYGTVKGAVKGVKPFEATAYFDPEQRKLYYRFNGGAYDGKWTTEAHCAMVGVFSPDIALCRYLESLLKKLDGNDQ